MDELWDSYYGCKWDKFANFLSNNVIQHIEAHSLKEDLNVVDILYWGGTPRGKFTIKSSLNIIRNNEDGEETSDGSWELVWKLRVQHRVRVFIWLVLHDGIVCNAN